MPIILILMIAIYTLIFIIVQIALYFSKKKTKKYIEELEEERYRLLEKIEELEGR